MTTTDTTAGVELDARVAEKVMGWRFRSATPDAEWVVYFEDWWIAPTSTGSPPRNMFKEPPCYSTDIAAAFKMEAEIERRGLRSKYARELVIETQGDDTIHCVWALAHATPLQRCTAALRTVDALEKK